MIKNFSRILLVFCCLFVIMSCSSEAVKTTAFKVGDNYYKSLQDACDAIAKGDTGSVHTVKIVKDASGSGVDIKLESETELVPNYIFIDLGENKYTVNDTTTATDADFKISGGMLWMLGDGGEIVGSGKTFFSLNDSQMVVGRGLTIESDSILVEANTSDVIIDAYFNESIDGNIKLNNGKLYINSKEGSIKINNLDITGKESQVVFNEPRTTNDMEIIGKITIDSQNAPNIPFTTGYFFEKTEYDEIDEILKTRKIHRHTLGTGELFIEATCSSDEYYSYKCNECDVSVVRAKENSTNPDKHNLTHIAAVKPTPTTSGIEECMRCEYCGKYFDINDNTKVVDPIRLATDNVLYSDLEKAGLGDLVETICGLEAKLDGGSETKGELFDTFSNILGVVGFAMDLADRFEGEPEYVGEMLEKLGKIEGDVNTINTNLELLLNIFKSNLEYGFLNERKKSLVDYRIDTANYYKEILEELKKSGDHTNFVQDKVQKWYNAYYAKDIVNIPKRMMIELTGDDDIGVPQLTSNPNGFNYLESYDYYAKSTCGFESRARECRTALFTLEGTTMLMGYKMACWYYTLCQNNTTEVEALKKAWTAYKAMFKDYVNNNLIQDGKGTVTCWLDGYNGRAFSTNTRIVKYAKELESNRWEYCLDSHYIGETQESIDKLIKNSNGECIPSDFYEKVYKWYNGNRADKDKKNIYQILEYVGFEPPVGEKWTDKNYGNSANDAIFLVSDPGGDYKDEGKEGKYRMIIFYQNFWSSNNDWVGIRTAYGVSDISFKVKKMYTEANYRRHYDGQYHQEHGKITKLGTPTKYQFFTLDYYTQPAK